MNWKNNQFIKLKDNNWLEKQRVAGKIAANTLSLLEKEIANKTTLSLIELNILAEDFIINAGAIPTFKGYLGFPAGCCISVNKCLVHGIPTDYKLQDGDVISFDLGATVDGAIADTAITRIYGTPKSNHVLMIKDCEDAIYKGISAIAVGKRLGVIGHAIYMFLKHNYKVIDHYGGHGICTSEDGIGIPHAQPFVANKSDPADGIVLQEGLALAIEPMIGPKNASTKTHVGPDKWSVYTDDIFVHSEHSIFIHKDSVEIITLRN